MNSNSQNWSSAPLLGLANYYNGIPLKQSQFSEEGLKIIRIEQLNNPTGKYDYYNGTVHSINEIRNGDLIFSWSATLKVVIWKHGDGVLNQHLFKVEPLQTIDKSFIYYLLENNLDGLGNSSQGSTMKHVTRNELNKFLVYYPNSLIEQRKIAKILTTVDNLIEQTEAAIAKYQSIKQGMMHDLFTRGVDANGTFGEFTTETHQFPSTWNILPLGNVADISSGITLGRKISGAGTIELPYLRVANVQDGKLNLDETKTLQVYKNEVSKYLLLPGDLLLTEGGDFDKLGRGTLWNGEIADCLHQNHIFRVRPIRSIISPEYLECVVSSEHGKRYFLANSKQTTNLASINSTQLKALPVPCPSLGEQERIVSPLLALKHKAECEQSMLSNLLMLKSGLMQDLLSGRVRVPTDPAPTQEPHHAA